MDSQALQRMADKLRFEAVRMIYEAKDGHPGPALSVADIVATLYFDEMNIDSAAPLKPDRDRFILSKGHACPILYAALNEKGFFGERVEHFNLRALGSIFQGHPVMQKTPGVDFTSGSLGNGIAIACGMAIAGKVAKQDYNVFTIVGDGELQEGIIWEGVHLAAAKKLNNMIVFVDKNGWQSGDGVEAIMGHNEIADKFVAAKWHTMTIDGHDIKEIKRAIAEAKTVKNKPSAIVCNNVKGKGLSFMEHDNNWHKGVPTDEQYELAKKELGVI